MKTVEPLDTAHSPNWVTVCPRVTVVIATHNRSAWLVELVDALANQRHSGAFEIVIADDGSTDDTWAVLTEIAATTALPFMALRLPLSGGPSVPRNTAVGACHGEIIAFTDDDCVPARNWLHRLLPAALAGRVVQGATKPARDGQVSPWDRTISISRETGLWESCNLALPRRLFESAGGFPILDLIPGGGRGFGEDAVLGTVAVRMTGGYWASSAIVRHRWHHSDYRAHLRAMRRNEAMPGLIKLIPELRDYTYKRVFRSRRSATCTAAVVGVATAVVVRRAAPLVAVLPWAVLVTRSARGRWGRPLPVRAAQEATADLVGLAATARGSARTRTLLL